MTPVLAVLPLAQTPAPSGVSAGYVALLIVVLLGLATVLLIRNMSGRLKRLPERFVDGSDRPREERPPGR